MLKKTVSGIMLTLLLTGILTLAFNMRPVKASGTIYIRANGSIDPPIAPISTFDNATYTFTNNIYDSIVIERDSIIVDGAGYMLQSGTGIGIDLSNRNNVTIKNMKIDGFNCGIWLYESSNNTLTENNVTTFFRGISLTGSSNNTLTGNNMASSDSGIWLYESSNNTLSGNKAAHNYDGIDFNYSSNNTLAGNILAHNTYGATLISSSNNSIVGNDVANNWGGVSLYWSSNNSIVGNKITANDGNAIDLWRSSNNSIVGNNVANNYYGISLSEKPSNNSVHHNNFINNAIQTYTYNSANNWDDGYPSGGNYWSDYKQKYPNAKEIDDSGVWDTPYIIDGKNRDNYPLMGHCLSPWSDWAHYHNYTEIVNTILYLNDTYPKLVEVFSIGKSWQNRDIYCIKLTDETNTHPKPKVFFVGYHHAREPISAELALYFAVDAVTSFGTNATITHMLSYSEIYIVPALNVDAFEAFRQNEWQRKNVHPYDEDNDTLFDEDPPDDEDSDGYIEDLYYWDGYTYYFIRWEGLDDDSDGSYNEDWVGGVDLNRNYGYQWNATCDSGSPYPWAEDYRGPAPFSEPETQAIRDLALSNNFKYAVSFHSGAEVILYPWGYTDTPTPHNSLFREVAGNLSSLIGAPYGQSGGSLYTSSGLWDDWMYANRSTFALTCEIYTNNSAWQYEPGPDPNTWWEKGVFQFFNPDPSQIETVIQRWLPVFTYTTNRAITEAYDTATNNVTPLKTIVGQGYSMHINVTVANQGEFTETFNVKVYANTTVISQTEVTLTSGNSTTITFTWNTTGFAKGNYTIWAYAWPVQGETDTADNTRTDGWVFVGIVGDVNGNRKVDLDDVLAVAIAYGSIRGTGGQYWHQNPCQSCPHSPNLDIDDNGKIDLTDYLWVAMNYGKVDP